MPDTEVADPMLRIMRGRAISFLEANGMNKYFVLLSNMAITCAGATTIAGCTSTGHTTAGSSERIVPQATTTLPRHTAPTLVPSPNSVPAKSVATPADSKTYAMVPETVAAPSPTYAHAADYSWIEGPIEFIHAGPGQWKLRYVPLSEDDPFGGSVILDSDIRLEKFNDGDIVHVEGELVRSRSSVYVSGPLYRVHSIRLIRQAE